MGPMHSGAICMSALCCNTVRLSSPSQPYIGEHSSNPFQLLILNRSNTSNSVFPRHNKQKLEDALLYVVQGKSTGMSILRHLG